MAAKRTQNIHDEHERSLTREVPEIHAGDGAAGVGAVVAPPPPMAQEQGLRDESNLHDSFMQCPRCCNCTPGCSHYGNGHFDDNGNYRGPGEKPA